MKDSKESASAAALIAPIEALIEYHEKYAKSHVSSKWIYGENMMVIQAYKKVLQMIEAQSEPGADTGTTPPPDVWTCEACGYKSDDIGEYREVCGKCFSAAAERGTTPPRETAWLIERHDMTRTQWLCCDSGEFEWTADPRKPLRLARREDAEQLALLALPNRDDIDVRITEHQWGM